jgi:hypothetical protein
MIEKYNPDHIIMNTWGRFSGLDEYKDSEAHDFKVYIEIKESDKEMYVMGGYKNNFFLLKDTLRTSKTTITSPKNLFKDKDLLGRVHVEFRKKQIKSYQSYDEFWEDIKQE